MRIVKQSTSVDLPIGPFLDTADGFTAKTALSLTQPDIRLKKNGANWAQKNAAQTLSHEENGYYEVTLDATDTDTLGQMRLAVNKTGALPIWEDFMVVTANVWDTLSSTAKFSVDVNSIASAAITATSINTGAITSAKFAAGAIDAAAIADGAIDAATFASGAINAAAIATDAITAAKVADGTIDAATFASNAITAGSIASGAITSAKFATDAIDSTALAASAANEVRDAILTATVDTFNTAASALTTTATLKQALSIILSVCAGITSSNGATLKTPDGTSTRVAATIDASNNRTAMSLTPST